MTLEQWKLKFDQLYFLHFGVTSVCARNPDFCKKHHEAGLSPYGAMDIML